MRVSNWYLVIGAALSMIGSYFIIISQDDIVGNTCLGLSNIFLFWYAYCTIVEFLRNLALSTDESSPE